MKIIYGILYALFFIVSFFFGFAGVTSLIVAVFPFTANQTPGDVDVYEVVITVLVSFALSALFMAIAWKFKKFSAGSKQQKL